MKSQKECGYILGCTIGTSSIGWSALNLDANGEPTSVRAMGVRIFPTGTDGDIESGRDLSRNKARQGARKRRVQLRRKKQRRREIRRLLVRIGLVSEHEELAYHSVKGATAPQNPYVLRAKALDERIEPHELARVLYHLAHRRGFQDNCRTERQEENDDASVVRAGIKRLEEAMASSGARTLGEHLFKLPPLVARRRRWTSRAMYRDEFQQILATQVQFYPMLTESVQKELARLLFFQRPLKSQAFRVGPCELEPSKHRIALAHPFAQEFRLLQKVNDLRIVDDVGVDTIEVTAAMRTMIAQYLMGNPHITWPGLRKLLGLSKTARFNFERAEEKSLTGHRTAARLGLQDWPTGVDVSDTLLVATVEAMLEISEDDGLRGRLTRLGYDSAIVERFVSDVKLEDGYLHLSRRAVLRLLPLMRAGKAYMTAVKEIYPAAVVKPPEALERLPFVHEAYPHLANPLTSRGFAELRKILHAVIKKHGTPARIHVELHRHLQTGPRARQAMAKRWRARQKAREAAAALLLKDLNITGATPHQIDRILLAQELNWKDPHTGKTISTRALCGGAPTFDVMHILPFDMTLDDDFSNKTIAHVSFIAKRHPESLLSEMNLPPEVEQRYAGMEYAYRDEKVRRLRLTRDETIAEYGEKFPERFIESASYLADIVREYVSKLGVPVVVSRPRVTAYVREALGLSRECRDMRGDHRHHAFNAIALALTTPTMVRQLLAAAKKGELRRFATVKAPWANFSGTVIEAVHQIVPSFRVRRRVRGPLHSENPLSKPFVDASGKVYHLSKRPLAAITESDLKKIAGTVIRDVVIRQFEKLKQQDPKYKDPKKAFGDPQNLPIFCGSAVRHVNVIRTDKTFPIGSNGHTRYVTNKDIHHALIRGDGKKWTREIVNQFEAQRRLVAGEKVVRDGGLFSLSKGEIFEMDDGGKRVLMRCRSVNEDPRAEAVTIFEARPLEEVEKFRESVEQLRKRNIKKVVVDLLGEVKRDGT